MARWQGIDLKTPSAVPDRGDLVWVDFSPQKGHEQAGHRPAIVLTAFDYNEKRGLAVLCPITSKVRGLFWEVELPEESPIGGAILSDQLKSMDYRARDLRPAGFRVSEDVVEQVLTRVAALLELK